MDYATWLHQATLQLAAGESPKRDSEILLQQVTGRTRSFILAFGETQLTAAQLEQLEQMLQRRMAGEPIAYITGEREFWSLSLAVSPATLIPRPDTESVVELALRHWPQNDREVLDLGCGTGAIALALAKEHPTNPVLGVDIAADAVMLAQSNARRLGIDNVSFSQSDWFSALTGRKFALIVANPPYIDGQDPHLQQGDVRFEPRRALVAEENGLADLRHIIEQAPHFLLPGSWLLLEHGWQQGAAVRALMQHNGFSQVATCQDYGGNDRVTIGSAPEQTG
ncbi:MAG: peptide chain release factor N(5)-glutamine methyltransferase [Enterobacteriaceae bacterium]